jgi:dGTPase
MLTTRAELEDNEAVSLAPYALLARDSRGRRYTEGEPAYRTAFQRDRDRIVHSAAFRRLEYKTQVFVNDMGDYYRTRLTHTLEVAQIGRTMARALGANEDLVETICLAHDLGHTPFGHAGEHVLDALLAPLGGFNHNSQSFRVVTELEARYPAWPGLNLSFETLEGIAKHETEYDVSRISGFDPGLRASLEAQIANLADEVAYNAHDLDDGLHSGLISPDQVYALDIGRSLMDRIGWAGGAIDEVQRHRLIRELVGLQVDDLVHNTADTLEQIQPGSAIAIQRLEFNVVRHSPPVLAMTAELKAFLLENMYRHWRIIRMQKRAEHFITELFNSYLDEPRQLPPDYQVRMVSESPGIVVADYIAGLTDRSAELEYRRLFDPLVKP